MECQKEKNSERCKCTYQGCPRKGMCCECIKYHVNKRALPACCFPEDAEKTYDRSFEAFAKAWDLGEKK